MTPFALSGLLTVFSSMGFGIFVFWKSRDRQIGRIWLLFTLAVAGWGFGAWGLGNAKSAQVGLLWAQWGYILGVVWIGPLFYHFVCTFLDLNRNKFILIHYLAAAMFIPLVLTRFFFRRVDFMWDSLFFMRSGPAHYLFSLWWFSLVIYSHFLLLRAYRHVSESKRNQMKYFFLATALGFTGGGTCYLPNFDIGMDFYPWGNFAVCLYPFVMSYAIVKHQLLDINLIIRKTLIYSTVTASLTAMYVMIMTFVARALEGWVMSPTIFSSAIAACAMALLFHPLRMWIQRFVDKHFFREALDQALLREATSGFVHEIKRPLGNISVPAELGLMDVQDLREGRRSLKEVLPKIEKRFQYILDEALNAGSKIEALRQVSAADGQPLEQLALADIIKKSLSAEDALIRKNSVNVILEFEAKLPVIKGHAEQLEIVFTNLIRNAAQALSQVDGKNEKSIWIKAYRTGENVSVSVRDSGPGVKRENMPHLFEPYFTTKGDQGMGMGLYLCRQILQAHRGKIELLYKPEILLGQGAEFTIYLPSV